MIPVIDHTTVFGRLYLDELAHLYVHQCVEHATQRQTDAARSRASYASKECRRADLGAPREARRRDDQVMHFMHWYRAMAAATPAQALARLFPEDFQP